MSSVKIAFVLFIYKNLLSFLSEKQKTATRVAVFCYLDLINIRGNVTIAPRAISPDHTKIRFPQPIVVAAFAKSVLDAEEAT